MATELFTKYEAVTDISDSGVYRFATDLSVVPPVYSEPMPGGIAPQHVISGRRPRLKFGLIDQVRHEFPDLEAVYPSITDDSSEPGLWYGQTSTLRYHGNQQVYWFEMGHFPPRDGETLRFLDRTEGLDGSVSLEIIGSSDIGPLKIGMYWRGTLIVNGNNRSEFLTVTLESIGRQLKAVNTPIWRAIKPS